MIYFVRVVSSVLIHCVGVSVFEVILRHVEGRHLSKESFN